MFLIFEKEKINKINDDLFRIFEDKQPMKTFMQAQDKKQVYQLQILFINLYVTISCGLNCGKKPVRNKINKS